MGAFLVMVSLITAEPKVIGPREAVRLAAQDVASYPAHDHCFLRYTWDHEPMTLTAATVRYAQNTAVSQADTLYKGELIAGGFLIRWDLRHLFPEDRDLKRYLTIERKLSVTDPYTHQTGLQIGKDGKLYLKVPCDPYTWSDGKVYRVKVVPIRREEQFAEHTGLEHMLLLHSLTDSDLPLVHADWWQNVILTTINVGLTKGVYYDLRGFRGLNQQQILQLFGADEKDSENLGGDSRAAIFHSGVTDRSRRIDAFFGRGVRPTAGLPLITLSHDIALSDVAADQDPVLNILEVRDTAREGVFVQANGMLAGVLFNGKGELQDVVPDQIAHDRTVPSPSPKTLVPIISCLACHGEQDGFLSHGNDIRDLYLSREFLPGAKQSRIVDDLSVKDRFKALDLAYGKYRGDLNPIYAIARALHSTATKEVTGYGTKEVTTALVESRNAFAYGRYDNRAVLYEIGHEIEPEGESKEDRERFLAEAFDRIVPPRLNEEEDGRITALRSRFRKHISRAQLDAILPYVADEAYRAAQKHLEN